MKFLIKGLPANDMILKTILANSFALILTEQMHLCPVKIGMTAKKMPN